MEVGWWTMKARLRYAKLMLYHNIIRSNDRMYMSTFRNSKHTEDLYIFTYIHHLHELTSKLTIHSHTNTPSSTHPILPFIQLSIPIQNIQPS